MTITTTRSTRRLGLASSAAAAALLLLASACGTETAASQAPGSITRPAGPVDRDRVARRPGGVPGPTGQATERRNPCTPATEPPEASQPLYLAPSGRPVPLPGQHG